MAKAPKKTKKTVEKVEKPEETFKVESFGPFDYIKAIQQTKVDIIRTSDNPDLAEKDYNPFITNKALSFHVDSILYCNEMNTRHGLDKQLQFDYFINTVRSMKRPYVWLKKTSDEDIKFLKETFEMNDTRAKEAYAVMGPEKVAELRKNIVTGGVVGKK